MGHTQGKHRYAAPGTPALDSGSGPNLQGLAEVRSEHYNPTPWHLIRAQLMQNQSLHRWFSLPSPVMHTEGFTNFNPYQSTP